MQENNSTFELCSVITEKINLSPQQSVLLIAPANRTCGDTFNCYDNNMVDTYRILWITILPDIRRFRIFLPRQLVLSGEVFVRQLCLKFN